MLQYLLNLSSCAGIYSLLKQKKKVGFNLKYGIQFLFGLVLLTLSSICQMYMVMHAFMYSLRVV